MTKDEIRAEIERLENEYRELEAAELARYAAAAIAYQNAVDGHSGWRGHMSTGLIAAWPHMPETVALQEELAALKAPPTYQPGVWYDWHGGECPVSGMQRG